MITIVVIWRAKYNGVDLEVENDLTDEQIDAIDLAGDELELACMIYDMCESNSCFEDPSLTTDQIDQVKLVVSEAQILNDMFGEFDVRFEYDHISS